MLLLLLQSCHIVYLFRGRIRSRRNQALSWRTDTREASSTDTRCLHMGGWYWRWEDSGWSEGVWPTRGGLASPIRGDRHTGRRGQVDVNRTRPGACGGGPLTDIAALIAAFICVSQRHKVMAFMRSDVYKSCSPLCSLIGVFARIILSAETLMGSCSFPRLASHCHQY